ncbi:MAG: DUF6152 family protein [Rhodobacteraceae bacterium]|jgi:hypothetical protein|nr:DUF6152 family protein [Paracoccaceae bacterium]MCZ8081896.1 DUF6152 family protein [Paracoccaceae bacterium]
MKKPASFRVLLLTSALAATSVTLAMPAAAHHGWSWAEAEETTLQATITAISLNPPHPELTVTDADGTEWMIELGNPGRTERAGFVDGTAKVGDTITILGNRSLDQAERLMKAVRITLAGTNYDFYPERIDA